MKSLGLLLIALLLTTAILAPSVLTLTSIAEKVALFDFNEEENKEEKKEASEKDFIFDSSVFLSYYETPKTRILPEYIENDYTTSITIFLPPPKRNF